MLSRWEKDKATYPGSITVPDTPEGGSLAEDGYIFQDMRIPINYKNSVAQQLWNAEDEAIKKEVRSLCESEPNVKTVYNTDGKERLELVWEYSK